MATAVLLAVPLTAHAVAEDADHWVPSDRLVHVNHAAAKSGYFCAVGQNPFCGNARSDFGSAIAVDGNTAVVGHSNDGRVHVYERIGTSWVETAAFSGPSGFASTVAVSGDNFIVGTSGGSGAWVYERSGTEWVFTQELSSTTDRCLGRSVDAQVGLILVGDPCDSSVHLFAKEGPAWNRAASLHVQETASLGHRVALAQEDLIIASAREAVYSFHSKDGMWTTTLVADHSVVSIDASGPRLAFSSKNGVAVYERTGTAWALAATLEGADISPFWAGESFGSALALSGDTLVVGAERDDTTPGTVDAEESVPDVCVSPLGVWMCLPPRPGAVYIYDGSEGAWVQTTKLVGDPAGDHWFGAAVALSTDEALLLVGAPYKLMSSVGGVIDVDPKDSVHIFAKSSVGV